MEDVIKRQRTAIIILSAIILIGIVSFISSIRSERAKITSIEQQRVNIQGDLDKAVLTIDNLRSMIKGSISDSDDFTENLTTSTTKRKTQLDERINTISAYDLSANAIIDSLNSTIKERYPFD